MAKQSKPPKHWQPAKSTRKTSPDSGLPPADKPPKEPAGQSAKASEPALSDSNPKPRPRDYARATMQLGYGWLKRHKALFAVTVMLGVALIVAAGFWLVTMFKSAAEYTNDELVIRVSRELDITGDANPSILTVVDDKRVSQPFLEESRNGDKVILYYKARQAVLFRPSEDRIVRSGSFTPPEAKLFLRRGTPDESRMDDVQTRLETLNDTDITSRDVSKKTDYDRTLVVDLTNRYTQQAEAAARKLGAELVRLPAGETVPGADILVIVGGR